MTNPKEKYQVYKTGETPKQAAERQVIYFQQIIDLKIKVEANQNKKYAYIEALNIISDDKISDSENSRSFTVFSNSNPEIPLLSVRYKNPNGPSFYDYMVSYLGTEPIFDQDGKEISRRVERCFSKIHLEEYLNNSATMYGFPLHSELGQAKLDGRNQ